MKKLFPILLSVALMSIMTVPALAEEQSKAATETKVINESDAKISGHSYEGEDEVGGVKISGYSYETKGGYKGHFEQSIDYSKYPSMTEAEEALKAVEENISGEPTVTDEEKRVEAEPEAVPEEEAKAEEPMPHPDNLDTKNQAKTSSSSIEAVTNYDTTEQYKNTIFAKWPVRLFLTIF